jgi:tetratricopeptide (TPR) repeat protein
MKNTVILFLLLLFTGCTQIHSNHSAVNSPLSSGYSVTNNKNTFARSLAIKYFEAGQYTKSLAVFNSLNLVEETDLELLYVAASCYLFNREYEQAVKYFTQAEPYIFTAQAYNRYGVALLMVGNADKAFKILDKAILQHPQAKHITANRILAKAIYGDTHQAAVDIDALIKHGDSLFELSRYQLVIYVLAGMEQQLPAAIQAENSALIKQASTVRAITRPMQVARYLGLSSQSQAPGNRYR